MSTTIAGSSIDPRYEPFTITDVAYKHVNGVPIEASILVPNDLKPGKHLVTVRWHGGGFGTGTRLFPPWYGEWNLALTTKHSAIAISPDYRLMPEARGADILADCTDFFRWLQTPGALAAHLPEGVEPELGRVLVSGESAGGWLAVQSGLVAPAGSVAAVIAHYPVLDLRDAYYTRDYEKPVGNLPFPWPRMGAEVVREHVAGLRGGEVVPSRMPPDGLFVTAALFQRGLFAEYFGTEEELFPIEMVGKVKEYPPIWIFHGTKDSIVPVEGTERFVSKLKESFPSGEVHATIVEGEDHGFDWGDAKTGAPATMATDWVKTGVTFIERFWSAA